MASKKLNATQYVFSFTRVLDSLRCKTYSTPHESRALQSRGHYWVEVQQYFVEMGKHCQPGSTGVVATVAWILLSLNEPRLGYLHTQKM